MLQRAGWKEGEGLGKDKEGTSAPGNVPQRSVMLLVPTTFLQTEVVFCVCVCVCYYLTLSMRSEVLVADQVLLPYLVTLCLVTLCTVTAV
jgi:G-patch domain